MVNAGAQWIVFKYCFTYTTLLTRFKGMNTHIPLKPLMTSITFSVIWFSVLISLTWVDCKTVGFFLKSSKEIGKAWRKSLRARVSHALRAYLNTQKYGLFCSLWLEWCYCRLVYMFFFRINNRAKIRMFVCPVGKISQVMMIFTSHELGRSSYFAAQPPPSYYKAR